MIEHERYVGRVDSLVSSLASVLTPEEQSEVRHLLEHGEPAEALRTLAWIVVDEDKRIPRDAIVLIKELSSGLIADGDLPANLDDHSVG